MVHFDDRVQPRAQKIGLSRRTFGRIDPSDATTEPREAIRGKSKKQNCKLPTPQAPKACNLKNPLARKSDSRSTA